MNYKKIGAVIGLLIVILAAITGTTGLFYELIFGYQGEFGGIILSIILSLIIFPSFGYLIGWIIEKIKR